MAVAQENACCPTLVSTGSTPSPKPKASSTTPQMTAA